MKSRKIIKGENEDKLTFLSASLEKIGKIPTVYEYIESFKAQDVSKIPEDNKKHKLELLKRCREDIDKYRTIEAFIQGSFIIKPRPFSKVYDMYNLAISSIEDILEDKQGDSFDKYMDLVTPILRKELKQEEVEELFKRARLVNKVTQAICDRSHGTVDAKTYGEREEDFS